MAKRSSKSSSSKRVHVISRRSGWAVKKEGTFRATKVYLRKDSAVKGAKRAALKGSDIVVHKRDGSIQKWVRK